MTDPNDCDVCITHDHCRKTGQCQHDALVERMSEQRRVKGVGSAAVGSASETHAGRAMRELKAATETAARTMAHLEVTLAFTLGDIKAAIELLEKGDELNALGCLRRAHRIGCAEMDRGPDEPNNSAEPHGQRENQ